MLLGEDAVKDNYFVFFDHPFILESGLFNKRVKPEPKRYPPLTIIEHGIKNILYEGDEIDLGYSAIMIKNIPYRFITTEHVKDIDLKYDFKVVSVEKMKGLTNV